MSGNLGIVQITAAQNQKEVTANAALLRLDAAITDLLSVSVAASNAALTAAQFQTAACFVVTGATVAGRTVTVPALRRLFLVRADAANTENVALVRGATSIALAPGQSSIFYADGTANGLLAVAGTPLAWSSITGTPTTLGGYGVTAVPWALVSERPTTFAGYGMTAPVAHAEDSAVAGGNARGANAVDWQTLRSAATQVASGLRAVVGGGSANTASAQDATVGGGINNTASALQAVVAGGNANLASGQAATVSGGTANAATTGHSWVPGGTFASCRANISRGAWAAGRFASTGDAQSGEFSGRVQTTDATAARATSDGAAPGAANTFNLPNNGTYRLKLLVVAQQTGGSAGTPGDCASWEADIVIKRGAGPGATVFVGGRTVNTTPALAAITAGTPFAPELRDAAAAAWRITVSADTTNGGLNLSCTGEVNKTIRWVARLMSVEVTA